MLVLQADIVGMIAMNAPAINNTAKRAGNSLLVFTVAPSEITQRHIEYARGRKSYNYLLLVFFYVVYWEKGRFRGQRITFPPNICTATGKF